MGINYASSPNSSSRNLFCCSMVSPRVRKGIVIVLLIVLWFIVSAVAGNLGKIISKQFKYPLTLTMGQLFSTAVYSLPLLYFNNLKNLPVSMKIFLRFIVPLSILKLISTAGGHLSIWNISVSYSQTIKASMPFFTVILGRIFFQIKQTPRIYVSLFPIVLGLAVATFTESEFSAFGMAAGVVGVVAQSIQHIINNKLMKGGEIHEFELLAILAKISAMVFLPIWGAWDGKNIVSLIQSAEYTEGWWKTSSLIALDGFLNFLQNILAFSMLKLIMPTSYAVAGASKRVFTIILSIIIFSTKVTVLNGLAMATAILGVFVYSYFRIDDKKKRERIIAHVSTTNGSEENGIVLTEEDKIERGQLTHGNQPTIMPMTSHPYE